MQFQVPQNITMEDRIIGSLTPIQFAIVVLGGLASFIIFTNQSLPSPLNLILGGGLGIVTIIMALGKFNDQPMYRFFRHIVAFVMAPKVRVWHKKGGAEVRLVRPNPAAKQTQAVHTVKKVSRQDIAKLAVLLDSRGTIGAPPKVDIKKVVKPIGPVNPGKDAPV